MDKNTSYITVNGEQRDWSPGMTTGTLIASLSLAPERLAVELNGTILQADDLTQHALAPGDRLEIIHFVGGG